MYICFTCIYVLHVYSSYDIFLQLEHPETVFSKHRPIVAAPHRQRPPAQSSWRSRPSRPG